MPASDHKRAICQGEMILWTHPEMQDKKYRMDAQTDFAHYRKDNQHENEH